MSSSAWLDYREQRGERLGERPHRIGQRAMLRSLTFILRPWGQKPIRGMLRIAELSGTTEYRASGRLISDLPPENLLSASDMMILGLFPPSSRVTLLRLLFPAAVWIRWPTYREAGTETNSAEENKTKCSQTHRTEAPAT